MKPYRTSIATGLSIGLAASILLYGDTLHMILSSVACVGFGVCVFIYLAGSLPARRWAKPSRRVISVGIIALMLAASFAGGRAYYRIATHFMKRSISDLAHQMVAQAREKGQHYPTALEPKTLDRLVPYPFKGHVRYRSDGRAFVFLVLDLHAWFADEFMFSSEIMRWTYHEW